MAEARSNAARKAWRTRKSPKYKADRTEQASKNALSKWCERHGWKVIFFEGKTGAPRTGIVDAVIVRIRPGDADAIEVCLIQLKAGAGGLTAIEISRMKKAVGKASLSWLLAAFDGDDLHFLPGTP
ncbi:MAG: hypothetical protein HY897_02530 [Deltaproteobacteria bacterium]|nr:hypothetical protein [Deltaproteobacteria bacterium]